MTRGIIRSVALLALISARPCPARSAEDEPEIRAVAGILPPLVFEENGQLTGFSIDLWNEVAARLKARTNYEIVREAEADFEALRAGKADIAVTGRFYAADSHLEFDYTYPMLDVGLQVMVRGAGSDMWEFPGVTFLRLVFSTTMLYWLGTALVLVLVPAHVVWLLERSSQNSTETEQKYIPGIFRTLEWAVAGLLGQVAQMPRHALARVLAHIWLFTGIVFVAFFTAHMTTALTVQYIRGTIHGPADLPGKSVATVTGTYSADYLRQVRARLLEYENPEEMFAALESGEADAVVFGSPPLQYYAAHKGAGRVRLVGPEFRTGNTAFVVPSDSPLRRKVNGALVEIRADGTYQRIHEKWFGKGH